MNNKFTCLSLHRDSVITGDKSGRIIEWSITSESVKPTHHKILGEVNEEIVGIYSSGLTKLCITKSGKVYFWTTESVRYGFEMDLRIADCELINTISCPPDSEETGCYFSYLLSRKLSHPTLEKYIYCGEDAEGAFREFINIESGEVEFIEEPTNSELGRFFYANGFVDIDGDYLITPNGIWERDSQTKLSTHYSYGAEFELENHDNYSLMDQWVYSAGGNGKSAIIAFVDDILDYEEANDEFFYVRVAKINCSSFKQDYELLGEPLHVFFDPEAMLSVNHYFDLKIKKSEATKFSFHEKMMATITEKGVVKVFDIEKKQVMHQIDVLPQPETNEFGEII